MIDHQLELCLPASYNEDLARRTDVWIRENPKLWRYFTRFALDAADAGVHFGIGMIAERVRYECRVKWKSEFKINNSYRAYIARRLIEKHPTLREFMELRRTTWGKDPKADQEKRTTRSSRKPDRQRTTRSSTS